MSKVTQALQLFREGNSCARSIRTAYGSGLAFPQEDAKQIAAEFAATLQTGKTCGAVTGAFTVLVQHSAIDPNTPPNREEIHANFAEIASRFQQRNEFLACRDLIGYDITTEEGMRMVKEQKLFKTRCIHLVKDAAEILEAILSKKQKAK